MPPNPEEFIRNGKFDAERWAKALNAYLRRFAEQVFSSMREMNRDQSDNV